jgi:hypothetical protein
LFLLQTQLQDPLKLFLFPLFFVEHVVNFRWGGIDASQDRT